MKMRKLDIERPEDQRHSFDLSLEVKSSFLLDSIFKFYTKNDTYLFYENHESFGK